jgi:beta-mannosidase
VPGTAAAALGRQARDDFDAEDWIFRTRFHADAAAPDEEVVLHLDGIATVAEALLNGEPILARESMFAAHAVDVGALLRGDNELEIRCAALGPLLDVPRKPRARWRTRIVANGGLRFFRTSIFGRAPGFAPGPAPVGPWRPVWLERRRRVALDELALLPRLDGDDGVLAVRGRLRALGDQALDDAVEVELSGPSGVHRARLPVAGDGGVDGELRVPGVARWWPHTHGDPALHDMRLRSGEVEVAARRVGFRTLAPGPGDDHDVEVDGIDLHVNGVRVFARGAVWMPVDPVGLAPDAAQLRAALEDVAAAGMNMLRVPGIGVYESREFHDLCDELGILVWQDLMLANMDYPVADESFRATVEAEVRDVLAAIAGRPSTAVVCGNSEVEQQVAMLGLDPALGRGELFAEMIPALLAESGAGAAYVPSAPCGGVLPFRPGAGVANYFGVGAYLRPLDDARRAGVRFASECLAFANVPANDADWDRGVPRDVGATWDFADVRDHYLERIYGVDPAELRSADLDRYLELSRAVTGEVMAEVFGEWRRAASPCGGALVLWLRDVQAGAGWGVVDSGGEPKVAYHHLRRALAPVAVWTVDEGLGGIVAHVANEGTDPLLARLRVALYRDFEQRVEEASEHLELGPHEQVERDVEAVIGRFVDASFAYRFGPPAHDAVVVSLESPDGALLSQAFRFPTGPPIDQEPAERIGLEATAVERGDGALELEVTTRRLAYGVRIHMPGYAASDDGFSVEPGGRRTVEVRPRAGDAQGPAGELAALNMSGRVPVTVEPR